MEIDFNFWREDLELGDLDTMAVFGDLCLENGIEVMGSLLNGYARGILKMHECKQVYLEQIKEYTANRKVRVHFYDNTPIPAEIVVPYTTTIYRILEIDSFQFIHTLGIVNFTRRRKLKASTINGLKCLTTIKVLGFPDWRSAYPYPVDHKTIRGIMDETQ